MPKISVIIPVYNRTTELTRALESVLRQTYKNYEVIVVDDHSTLDITPAIPTLPEGIPLSVLKSVGKGVSAARNTGIKAAKGEFIALLDSDDEWAPTKLEQQINFTESFPEFSFIHSNETWLRFGQPAKQSAKHKKSGGDIFIPCTKLCVIAPSTVMLRKKLFEQVGLFDENFVVCEDFDLWLRITSEFPVGFLEEALVIKHGGHADQLSLQLHSMDLWRLRALAKHINNDNLDHAKKTALKQSLLEKAEILLKGFEKHKNYAHLEEVLKYKSAGLS